MQPTLFKEQPLLLLLWLLYLTLPEPHQPIFYGEGCSSLDMVLVIPQNSLSAILTCASPQMDSWHIPPDSIPSPSVFIKSLARKDQAGLISETDRQLQEEECMRNPSYLPCSQPHSRERVKVFILETVSLLTTA